MDSKYIKKISGLLYNENIEKLKSEVKNAEDPLLLHIIGANYNWDDGFEIATLIVNNSNCDLGTGLMIFYSADGYRILECGENNLSDSNKEWKVFINNLYKKIKSNNFKSQSISYMPNLTKVQVYKLKKSNPTIPNIFLGKSPGVDIEIPVL